MLSGEIDRAMNSGQPFPADFREANLSQRSTSHRVPSLRLKDQQNLCCPLFHDVKTFKPETSPVAPDSFHPKLHAPIKRAASAAETIVRPETLTEISQRATGILSAWKRRSFNP
jgi:hypothetical protein